MKSRSSCVRRTQKRGTTEAWRFSPSDGSANRRLVLGSPPAAPKFRAGVWWYDVCQDVHVRLAGPERRLGSAKRVTQVKLSGAGPQVLLPLQALVYPLPSHLLRAITELHANQLRAVHASRLLSSEFNRDPDSGASPLDSAPMDPEVEVMHAAALDDQHQAKQTREGRLRLCYCSIGFGKHPHGQLGACFIIMTEKGGGSGVRVFHDDGSTARTSLAA